MNADGTIVARKLCNHAVRPRRLAEQRTRIGMVFQQFNLFPNMTAEDNVMSGPVLVKRKARVAIARALAMEPTIMLCRRCGGPGERHGPAEHTRGRHHRKPNGFPELFTEDGHSLRGWLDENSRVYCATGFSGKDFRPSTEWTAGAHGGGLSISPGREGWECRLPAPSLTQRPITVSATDRSRVGSVRGVGETRRTATGSSGPSGHRHRLVCPFPIHVVPERVKEEACRF
ncbi:hypothetical protein ABZ322_12860 [Streptomyces sp. NPDC006129]|uniref:hypothetical protein n=1 Tax=Streptomyces sp. NPDC006129 TaxID=3155348 RepID=UPI0033B4794E